MNMSPEDRMRSYLQLVATGPELSKSLTQEQAQDALNLILEGSIDEVRAGIFLIALRMKRETDAENIGALKALMAVTEIAQASVPDVMAVADPFNGYLRGLPATAFLPAVLAACGLPAYHHGVYQVGPKYGITTNLVLQAAGKSVDLSVVDAAARVSDKDVGWAYIDQAQMIPALHDLVPLRDKMVKRCCLSTLEVVLQPIVASQRTHLLTGFVHKAYPPVYAALASEAGFDSMALVRGVEGGCFPSLSQVSRYFSASRNSDLTLHKLTPKEIGIEQTERCIGIADEFQQCIVQTRFNGVSTLQPLLTHVVELGLDALAGKSGPIRDSLIYAAAIALVQTNKATSLQTGADKARTVLDDGTALARFTIY